MYSDIEHAVLSQHINKEIILHEYHLHQNKIIRNENKILVNIKKINCFTKFYVQIIMKILNSLLTICIILLHDFMPNTKKF